MPNALELMSFCEHYWSHPYWKEKGRDGEKWIRLSFLPSKLLVARLKKERKRAAPSELVIVSSELTKEKADRILSNSEKGFDIYYFANVVPKEKVGFATSEDVVQRLYLPIDLDYRLPVDPKEFREELGLQSSFIVETSRREGWPHHQFLFPLGLETGRKENESEAAELARELCSVTFSDSVTDAKRILRLPGTINWKLSETGKEPSEVRMVEAWAIADGYNAQDIGEAAESFKRQHLYEELRELSFRPVRSGGVSQGVRGEWGSWEKAYERAERGEPTVLEGGRHNALISWGGQMSRAGIAPERIKQNLILLGREACSPSYFGGGAEGIVGEGRDFVRMWSYLSEHLQKIRSEESFDDDVQDEGSEGSEGEERGRKSITDKTEGDGDDNANTDRARKTKSAGALISSDKDLGDDAGRVPGGSGGGRRGERGDSSALRKKGTALQGGVSKRVSDLFSHTQGRKTTPGGPGEPEGPGPQGELAETESAQRENGARASADRRADAPGGSTETIPGTGTVYVNGKSAEAGPEALSAVGSEGAGAAGIVGGVSEEPAESPLAELEAELKAAETLALGKFKSVLARFLTQGEAGIRRAAHMVLGFHLLNQKFGEETIMVNVVFRAFEDLKCAYGEYLSAIAQVQTLWGSVAKYTVGLSEKGLVSVVDHALREVSKVVKEKHAEIVAVPQVAVKIKSSEKKDSKFALVCPANAKNVRVISEGLKRRVAGEFAKPKSQTRRVIAFQNGFYDLGKKTKKEGQECGECGGSVERGEFIESPEAPLLLAHPLMVHYVKESPREDGAWNRFLRFAFPDDEGTIEAIYRMMGYCATNDVSLQKIFMLEGITGSGKSTLSGVLMSCLGINNSTAGMYRQLAEKDSLSQCEGKILCAIEEAESGEAKIHGEAARRLKEASSGQSITLRPLHENERQVTLPTKFILLCNKGVQFEDTAGALARRLVTFRFERRVPETDVVNDADFRRELLGNGEADRIMSEAARRFGAAWRNKERMFEGLGSRALEKGREGAMDSLDPVGSFIRRYVSVGTWSESVHEGPESRQFLPSGVLINAIFRTRPEMWDRNHGRTWVQREAVRAIKTIHGVEVGKHRLSCRMECRGYRGLRIDVERLVEEVGLESLCKGLEQSARKALEEFYNVDTSGVAWDSETVDETDLGN